MLPVAEVSQDPKLIGFRSLPKYEFVQDIEETADIDIEEVTKQMATKTDPVDSFWFFEPIEDLSHLGAASALASSETETVSGGGVPIAVPGSYQLFLPDPDMMDRLGEIPPSEIYQADPTIG